MPGSNPPPSQPPLPWQPPVRYSFTIDGELSDRVLAAFPELAVTQTPKGITTLRGPVADPGELRALLARFDDLGLSVLEIVRCDL